MAHRAALRAYWDFAQRHKVAVEAKTTERALQIPAFRVIMEQLDPATLEHMRAEGEELQRIAFEEDNWEPYLTKLREDGSRYAQMGVPFGDWYELVATWRDALMPAFHQTWPQGGAQSELVLRGMGAFLDMAMREIATSYLDERQALVARANQERDRYIAELKRSNAELEQFAYVASHDLQAPLRDIHNLASWIEDDAGEQLEAPIRDNLHTLRQRVHRMERLLEDLLAYSQAGRRVHDAQPLDIQPLMDAVRGALSVPEGFVIQLQADGAISAPRVPVELVLRNLIANAIKHHDKKEGTVRVSLRQHGDTAEVTVADDGPGIAPEYHERVFRMFQTLRPRDEVEGSGMGLALVRRVVEAHGGRVTIESVGRGTAFHCTFPAGSPA